MLKFVKLPFQRHKLIKQCVLPFVFTLCASSLAEPLYRDIKTHGPLMPKLSVKKASLIDLSEGTMIFFQMRSAFRLEGVSTKDQFLGTVLKDDLVSIYVDKKRIPLVYHETIGALNSQTSLQDRISIAESLTPKLFDFTINEKGELGISFKAENLEIGEVSP